MKFSTIIATIGALVMMVFAFENLGQYLIAVATPDWTVFSLLMLIAGAVGALPGLMIALLNRGDSEQATTGVVPKLPTPTKELPIDLVEDRE